MKKHLLSIAAALSLAFGAYAALPYAPLALPAGAHHPVLSPDGKTLLFSSDNHRGLKAYSMTDGTVSEIDEAASAGFEPVFSTDSRTIYYRTAEMRDGLLYRDVRAFNIQSGKHRQLAKATREHVNIAALGAADYAVADYQDICVRRNGVEKRIRPVADSHSYLWATLSTEGQLLFSEPFQGVFVCDADGNNAKKLLPKGDFTSWAGKDKIIAVVTHDDGYVVLSSKLVMVDTRTGETTQLTDDDMLVGEATASETGTVIFSDINGNMFILNLNDR